MQTMRGGDLLDTLPLGFGMALTQNSQAMKIFSALPEQKQQEMIEQTHHMNSKKEMQAFIQSFSDKI
jgi:hypothetical protein